MLTLLGMFRAGAISADADAGAGSGVRVTTSAPRTGVTPPTSAESRVTALEGFRDRTFVVMGLILPIIGGIFASVGMARLHNALRYRRLTRERHRLRYLLDEASRTSNNAAAAARSLNHDLTAIQQQVAVTSGQYHSYLHAYETGLCDPDRERGGVRMATRLRDMVEKWMAIADQTQNRVRTEIVSDSAASRSPRAAPAGPAVATAAETAAGSAGC
jgi:hypothetical protein